MPRQEGMTWKVKGSNPGDYNRLFHKKVFLFFSRQDSVTKNKNWVKMIHQKWASNGKGRICCPVDVISLMESEWDKKKSKSQFFRVTNSFFLACVVVAERVSGELIDSATGRQE